VPPGVKEASSDCEHGLVEAVDPVARVVELEEGGNMVLRKAVYAGAQPKISASGLIS